MRFDGLRARAGLIIIGLLSMAIPATPAGAATYTVWSCRGPDGGLVSTNAWQPLDGGSSTADLCATRGYMRARMTLEDNTAGTGRGFTFQAPPGTMIAGYRIYLFAETAASPVETSLQAGLDVDPDVNVAIDQGCKKAGCTSGVRDPDSPFEPDNLRQADGLRVSSLFAGVTCSGLLNCLTTNSGASYLAQMRLFSSEVAIHDDDVPVVGAATGTLGSAPQPVSGVRAIDGAVSDEGGGLASVVLLIDGQQFAQAPTTCSQPYTTPAPCPPEVVASFNVDTTLLAPGAHSAELRATDAAGNTATGPAISFSVAAPDAALQVLSQPVVVPAEPTAVRVTVTRPRVAIQGPQQVTGTVKRIDGSPVAVAKVIVRSRPFGVRRGASHLERRLTTDPQGRFSMSANGSSRLLELDVDDKNYRAEEAAEVQLLQRLRVEASQNGRGLRNGSVMTLHADVDGAGRGARGKAALIQAIVGGRWTTVEELTLDDSGGAVWRYRFRGTTRTAVYRFRVRVPTAGDVWPWPTTDSPVLRVRVRR